MNISSRLVSERTIRFFLLVAALLVALGYLLLGESVASRVLGTIGALLVAVLLKVVIELLSQLRWLERDTSRLKSQLVESSTRLRAELTEAIESQERLKGIVRQNQALVGEIQQRTASLESTFSHMVEESLRVQEQSDNRIEVLREDIGRTVDELTTKLDELAADQQPVRRHILRANVRLRELGLRDSLSGLLTEDDSGAPE